MGAVFPGQLDRLSSWLRPEHFSRPAHKAIYAAMVQRHRVGGSSRIRRRWTTRAIRWIGRC
ncbi:DnaB-like helicase N-terminal domain-containing protein [Streptomyces sp. NBC_00057]|uniref:DnaB-like helicase N-terminal domain-containing protein n=1 Tax=Streptomyces sp. NBC_00057 TaxID=2975634 RepID=UPI003869BAC8